MASPGRPKGLPKTGGRKAGTPNKSTAAFRDTLDNLGFNVAAEAVKLYAEDLPLDIRLKLLELIASYSHSKPKVADVPPPASVSEEDDTLKEVSSEALANLVKMTK